MKKHIDSLTQQKQCPAMPPATNNACIILINKVVFMSQKITYYSHSILLIL